MEVDETETSILFGDVCVCCLDEHLSYVSLDTCEHVEFLTRIIECEIPQFEIGKICIYCHGTLKKLFTFKQQVENSFNILTQFKPQDPVKKATNLSVSECVIIDTYLDCKSDNVKIEPDDANLAHRYDSDGNNNSDRNNYFDDNVIDENNDGIFVSDDNNDSDPDFYIDNVKRNSSKESVREGADSDLPKPDFSYGVQEKKVKIKDMPLSHIKALKSKLLFKTRTNYLEKKYEGKLKSIVLTEKELQDDRRAESEKEIYTEKLYKCETCIKGFDYETAFIRHNDKKHKKQKGTQLCNVCKCYIKTDTYRKHVQNHFRRFECTECGRRRRSQLVIIDHIKQDHGTLTTVHSCSKCEFTTDNRIRYNEHMDEHLGAVKCEECDKEFTKRGRLRAHKLIYHSNSSFKCNECDRVCRTKRLLKEHKLTHRSEMVYCAVCDQYFSTKYKLEVHLKGYRHLKAIGENVVRKKRVGEYMCDECGHKFKQRYSLEEHISRVHLKLRNKLCSLCSKSFCSNTQLKSHIEYVHEKKERTKNKICNKCGEAFGTDQQLKFHLSRHNGENWYKCKYCDAQFFDIRQRSLHHRIHWRARKRKARIEKRLSLTGKHLEDTD